MKNKFNFKSIILTLTLLTLGVGQVWAGTRTIYFDTNGYTFKESATNFAVYLWNDQGNEWVTMDLVSGTIYSASIPDSRTKCIFCAVDRYGATGWDHRKAQTDDQTLSADNLYTVTSSNTNNGDIRGSWSTYGGGGGGGSTYTVTYNGNGKSSGSVPTDATSYSSGGTVTVSGKNTLAKIGYTFAGWNTKSDGSGTYYAPGATFSISANTTLYAIWYDNNVLGGTNVMFYIQGYGGKTMNYLVNSSCSKASTSYKITDVYSYVNTAKANLSSYDRISNNPDGSWSGNQNTGIQSANGGELFRGDGTISTMIAKTAATTASVTGDVLSLSTTCNSATGVYGSKSLYILYYLNSELIGVSYNSTPTIFVPAATTARASTYNVSGLSNGPYTLKTILTDGLVYYIADSDDINVAHSYSITYKDKDGGAYSGSNGASLPSSYTYGVGATLVNGVRSGYDFNGWYTASDCSSGLTTSIGTSETGAKTFYARWTVSATNSLTVTSTAGGSITTPAGGTHSDIANNTYYNIVASRSEGYKFTGWTKTSGVAVSFEDASALSTRVKTTTAGSATVQANFAAMSNSLSVDESSVYAGTTVTLTATRTNHTLNLKYQYKIGSGSWNTIATTSSTSQTYTIPYANTYQTYYFRVVSTDGSTDITSSNQTVEVKGRIIIKVKNSNNWGSVYLYSWYNDGSNHDTNGGWPGKTGAGLNGQSCSIHATGSEWWEVTITQETSTAQKFILNCNTSGDKYQTEDLNLSDFEHGGCYAMTKNASSKQTLPEADACPAAPTVTTSAASSIVATSATLGGNITATGNEKVSSYGYYYSTNSALSSSNLGVGTQVQVGTNKTSTGTYSKSQTGLTNGTTYYVIAYATNTFGTSYGSVVNFRTKYVTTVTLNQQGGEGGTTEVTATEGSAMPSGKIAPTKWGYDFGGYYASEGGSGKQYYNASMGSANNWDQTSKDKTIYAKWTAKSYDVILDVNGGSGDNQTVRATFDAAMPTTLKGGSDPIAARTRTGYNFDGYWANTNGTGTQYYTSALASNHNWDVDNNEQHIYAKWNAKQCTVTFDYQLSAEGHGDAGTLSNVTATYDAAMPALTGNMPTAANGYCFMGFYSGTGGTGTKYYNADKSSANNWAVNTESNTTLYAYYKKAEIISLVLDNPTIAPSGTVTATPTVSPTPVAPTSICWKLLRSNGNLLSETFSSNPSTLGNSVTFTAPSASGTYKVAAVLRTGNACNAGTVLDSVVTDLVVAGSHTVTIRYQDGDGRTLAASSSITGKPLEWTADGAITPPDITGYTFARWDAGDGVSIKNGASEVTTTTTSSIQIKAVYDGNLTAVYNKKNMIYFYNTVGWTDVWVYFYSSNKYWADDWGTGAWKGQYFSGDRPYYDMHRGQMTQIEGTNIWYFDYSAQGWGGWANVAFTNMGDQSGQGANPDAGTPDNDHAYFSNTAANPIQVIRRGDHNTALPMFVPLTGQTKQKKNNNKAEYLNDGYWMNYPENTGYTLRIYNSHLDDNNTGAAREYYFPYSADLKMPLKLDVEFNFTGQTWFMIYRNDNQLLGKNYTMKQGWHETDLDSGSAQKINLKTSTPGVYKFTLSFLNVGTVETPNYKYKINVEYPVGVGDYRIYYTDEATWSLGTAHSAGWCHMSDIIPINSGEEEKADTVSLFVSYGSSPSAKFQKVTAIDNETGAVTWADVAGGTVSLSGITKAGVYNFIVKQVGTAAPVVEKVEPYTGNYYIRTDCAGNTKWDSYTTLDHQMTYSDYAAAGTDGFTHYYCHWVTAGTNVRFTIANDYSVAVSDSLTSDTYTTESLVANANIRFMYDERTNIIKRAYISGSGNITDRFLVLEGDAKMYDENGNALTGGNQDHDKYDNYLGTDNQVILHDDENFVYERTIKVNATARAKLTAKYYNKVQYFKGTEGAFADGTTIQLLGGTYSAVSKYTMRIVYDFKTNRLVTAYMPEGEISGEVKIQADMMLIREHQGEATQLTFASGSDKLTDVKSVYGVMRFNRWTLNNRQHPEDVDKDHSDTEAHITEYHPLVGAGSMKSISERGLYWVSFPFDVNLSDVFGFGTYGTHWIMMQYNGAERARIGYWKDNTEGFWEYIWDRRGVTLKAGMGYVLALELDLMKYNDNSFWSNNIQQVELFFPSASSTTGKITQANVDVTIPSHLCTIDRRTDKTVDDWNKDRRIADSHWNIIGVPSYANYGSTLTDGSSTIEWHTSPKTNSLPFLYEWNANDNTYTVQSGENYPFKAMHAYYVQYAGTLHWTLASATPSSIVARRTYAEKPESVEFKLELMQNEKMIDQTFVKMSDDEEVSANFAFGEDLNKEKNAGKANIYTLIENYMPAAGNTLPMSDQTTVVPVGVTIAAAGEYTFAIPDGTSGVGVTLVDTETGVRTSLGLMDYTVTLTAGSFNQRFFLEISPVSNTPTGLEPTSDSSLKGREGAEKRLIDNKLFIITEDGKVFDARGAMVKSNE